MKLRINPLLPLPFGVGRVHRINPATGSALDKHADTFAELGVNPNDGLGAVLSQVDTLGSEKAKEIRADFEDGVLHVRMPKVPEAKSRRISIGSGEGVQG